MGDDLNNRVITLIKITMSFLCVMEIIMDLTCVLPILKVVQNVNKLY